MGGQLLLPEMRGGPLGGLIYMSTERGGPLPREGGAMPPHQRCGEGGKAGGLIARPIPPPSTAIGHAALGNMRPIVIV
jgi:hypothetical protein